jgi:hypothetical protein
MADDEPDSEYAQMWRESGSLLDLCVLTAMWLKGLLPYHPAYSASAPDPETTALVPHLAVLNEGGFLTEASQPGVPLVDGSGQRAFVEGFCDMRVQLDIERAILGTDIVMLAYPPGSPGQDGLQIPVTMDGHEPFTWVGSAMTDEVIDSNYRSIGFHPDAVAALQDSWQVLIFDPQWGRNDLLWDRLGAAIPRLEDVPEDQCFFRDKETGDRCAEPPTDGVFCQHHGYLKRGDMAAQMADLLMVVRRLMNDPMVSDQQRAELRAQEAEIVKERHTLLGD